MENGVPISSEEVAMPRVESPGNFESAARASQADASPEALPLDAPERTEVSAGSGDDMPALLHRLAQTLAEQNGTLEALRALCARYLPGNHSKDEAIARMQTRLDEYERGMLRALKEPLLRDLILFYDSLDKLLHKCENGALSSANFVRELDLLRAELLEIFSTQNLEPITHAGELRYQPELQKAVQVENAERPGENHLVTRVVREGFVWADRVLRKQEVAVKKWTARNEV